MRKVRADTNIIIDLLAKREPFYNDAAKLFSLADKKQIEISTSALTFVNTHYILLKENPPTVSREILRKFKILTSVLPLDDKIIDLALNDRL